jgi:small subunit ribosomal protein S5
MAENQETQNQEASKVESNVVIKKQDSPNVVRDRLQKEKIKVRRTSKGGPENKRKRDRGERDDYDTRIVSIRRVTRVYKGGKRMRLSAVVVVGDRKGSVGIGLGKGPDVRSAEEKAFNFAKKHMYKIQLKGNTIPHEFVGERGAARVFMKPASPGTGVIAGAAVRAVVEVAGIKDILTKSLQSPNHINNAYATLNGLRNLRLQRI